MSHSAETETQVDDGITAPNVEERINSETQLGSQANGIIDGVAREEHVVVKAPEAESAALTEQPVNSPIQETAPSEQELQNHTKEINDNAEQSNDDTPGNGNVRLPDDAALPKPVREDTAEGVKKPVRRRSTFSNVIDKTKSTFLPRGRASKRSTASHHQTHHQSHNGGCTIF